MDPVGLGAADVEADAAAGVDVETEVAADDDRERHREVRPCTLPLVLVEDGDVDELAPLVEAVESLSEADDALARLEPEGEAQPIRHAAADKPADAAWDESRPNLVIIGDNAQGAAVRLPHAGVELEPPSMRGVVEKPVAQPLLRLRAPAPLPTRRSVRAALRDARLRRRGGRRRRAAQGRRSRRRPPESRSRAERHRPADRSPLDFELRLHAVDVPCGRRSQLERLPRHAVAKERVDRARSDTGARDLRADGGSSCACVRQPHESPCSERGQLHRVVAAVVLGLEREHARVLVGIGDRGTAPVRGSSARPTAARRRAAAAAAWAHPTGRRPAPKGRSG